MPAAARAQLSGAACTRVVCAPATFRARQSPETTMRRRASQRPLPYRRRAPRADASNFAAPKIALRAYIWNCWAFAAELVTDVV